MDEAKRRRSAHRRAARQRLWRLRRDIACGVALADSDALLLAVVSLRRANHGRFARALEALALGCSVADLDRASSRPPA